MKIPNADTDIAIFWNTDIKYRTDFEKCRKIPRNDTDFKYDTDPSLVWSYGILDESFSLTADITIVIG